MEQIVLYLLMVQKFINLKEKGSEIVATPLCLENISKDFSINNLEKTGLYGYSYDFSVDYDVITSTSIYWKKCDSWSPKLITNEIVRSLDHQSQNQSKKINNILLILCIQVIRSREVKWPSWQGRRNGFRSGEATEHRKVLSATIVSWQKNFEF